ncbi:MAG: SLC13 family permease [Actinomycetota bacterium]|nr:SLC13 family permease [Actinomycetota bacterium]
MAGLDPWITLAVLAAVLVVLVLDRVSPVTAVLGGLVMLVLSGILSPAEAFSGFANPATVTIAALFVVSRAVQQTGLLGSTLGRVLGDGEGAHSPLLRLVAPTVVLSSVIANTPIVATLASPVRDWAERHGRPASHYLMPLSFAAILGGLITTIGTSTTLVVSGLVDQLGFGSFSLLEITPVGLPVAVAGAASLVAIAPRVLPDRRNPLQQVSTGERAYTFHARVEPGGPLEGTGVRAASLRALEGVYLAGIERGGREIAPVAPDEILEGGDVLTFVGRVDHVRDLVTRPGLKSAEEQHVHLLRIARRSFFEVVLGPSSPLVGQTPKELAFRGRYNAAIIAVHRAGERVIGKLGEVRLQAGDALLLLADPRFDERWRDRRDFLVVVALDDDDVGIDRRAWIALGVLVAMVAAAASGLVPILQATLAAVFLLVVTRTVSIQQARDALDLDVLLIIGGSLGLGAAVESSGIAATVASGIAGIATTAGAVGALAAVLLGTLVLTEMITNTAAAALMLPIGLQVATRLGADPHAFAIAIAVGASASFLTPIGYQTNTIVYGLGGYRFGDYWRLGLPITAITVASAMLVIPLVWDI